MDAELAKILDAAGLTGDARTQAEAAFNNEALGKVVRDGVLMRSDYSRKMDELAARRAQLEGNWEQAQREHAQLFDQYEDLKADRDSTAAEKAEAARKLKEAEDKLAAAPAPTDTSKFLTKEQFDAASLERERKLAAGMTAFSGEAMDAVDSIHSLTGTKVSYKKVLQESQAAGKTPGEWAEENYKLTEKRVEQDKAARDKEISDARAAERSAVLAEMANPSTRPMTASSDPFYVAKPDSKEGQNPWDATGPAPDEVAFLTELQQATGTR